ncbi:Protein will die slowly [Gryllus bimaculatus]|nr:Protein will die slowly [Gryllus bimaculatus]
MASSLKRSWRLQDFVAHSSNVNCVALGHKSGRVLVTGGDDKKVNLWAVGKVNCIMSLSGHTTPVECVQFGYTEEFLCAGSQAGALKIWDLEAAKIVRTLTGHKGSIRCIDFHPYGDFLTSGSLDTAVKVDVEYLKGSNVDFSHKMAVNSVKFSPDGQWIASGGEEGLIKLWDLRAGRLLKEFSEHTGAVTTVKFHPNEFLLASASADRSVNFWDLENFSLVSTSEKDVGTIRCITYSPDGECLFSGSQDLLKVHGWEPARTFDTLPMSWGKVQDVACAHKQLIGASCHITNVALHVVDLSKVQPFGGAPTPSPFLSGQSIRKSFSRDKPFNVAKATLDVKTIEEADRSGTDPEDEPQSFSTDIPNVGDYQAIFQPNRKRKPFLCSSLLR